MHIPQNIFKKIIIDTGLVTQESYHQIHEESDRTGTSIYQLLIEKEIIPEKYLIEFLSVEFDIPIVDLRKKEIDKVILNLLPESIAESLGVVVFEKIVKNNPKIEKKVSSKSKVKLVKKVKLKDGKVKSDKEDEVEGAITEDNKISDPQSFENAVFNVAMEDPWDAQTLILLEKKLEGVVVPHLTLGSSLRKALQGYQRDIRADFEKIINENIEQSTAMAGMPLSEEQLAESLPVVAIFDSILKFAASSNASDIHIEPEPKIILIRYRIDGILHDITSLPKFVESALIARIKVMSQLAIDEHQKPQDGRFKFNHEDTVVACRVSLMPTFYGEKVVIRLLVSSGRVSTLKELGFSDQNEKIINDNLTKTFGMVLATGPTGSGKTTTLYSILKLLNSPTVNICTVEDPIEYDVVRINQTQVNAKAGITFANGLRALLRQNPDIIMVGEIRDQETVDISIQASLTGHLVLSTLHTNDAPSTIARFVDMGAEPFLLSSILNVIIAQRLVRKICTSCIFSSTMSVSTKAMIKKQLAVAKAPKTVKIPDTILKGKGCSVCGGSGYSGQIGIYEVFNITSDIKDLIVKQVSSHTMRKAAIENGMVTMLEDGLLKIESGITTVEEVLRAIRE